jgi:outer membrane protein OmpA-like peptidoglycan-associated protein
MTISSKEFPYVLRDIYLKLSNYYSITYEVEDCPNLHNVTIPINIAGKSTTIVGKTSYYINDSNERNVGDTVFLNIEFDVRKSTITDKNSLTEIRNIADWLATNSSRKILIKGHTDDTGDKDYNRELSTKRAEAVKKELVHLGINENRITVKGFGTSKPLAPNDIEENRQKNRRTEIEVIE